MQRVIKIGICKKRYSTHSTTTSVVPYMEVMKCLYTQQGQM